MENTELRKVVLHPGNTTIRMVDLKIGDVFELYEPDGKLVGKYIAESDGYVSDGVSEVVAKPAEETTAN